MSNGLTFKLNIFILEICRTDDVRLETNACQISWQSDENCLSNERKNATRKIQI